MLNNTVIIRFLSQRFENEQLLLPAILGQTAALVSTVDTSNQHPTHNNITDA